MITSKTQKRNFLCYKIVNFAVLLLTDCLSEIKIIIQILFQLLLYDYRKEYIYEDRSGLLSRTLGQKAVGR